MFDFHIISNKKACFSIDTEIYSNSTVAKVCYWLNRDFIVSSTKKDKVVELCIESVKEDILWPHIQQEISQMFSDFQLREIINTETKDIRTILYVKAFANLDEFEEYGE